MPALFALPRRGEERHGQLSILPGDFGVHWRDHPVAPMGVSDHGSCAPCAKARGELDRVFVGEERLSADAKSEVFFQFAGEHCLSRSVAKRNLVGERHQ